MSEYDYSINHQSGEKNVIADYLSRCWQVRVSTFKDKYIDIVKWASAKNRSGHIIRDKAKRIVINDNRIREFLKHVHAIIGHRGITTLYYNLKNNIYIRGLLSYIKEVVNGCTICKRCKVKAYRIDKDNKIVAGEKFERVSTDIYAPFKITDYKTDCLGETGYVLTITDIFTRYTKIYFYENITAQEVIESLEGGQNCLKLQNMLCRTTENSMITIQ